MERAFERRPWLFPVALALLTIVFMRAVVVPLGPNYGLDGADFQAEFYPLHEYILQTIKSGELPLWNPHQFIGHPIAGDSQAALFYPATWLLWVVGVVRGIGLSLTFHIWLAAWGMGALLRRFNASYIGSLLAGVIYAMSGWAAARLYAGHYSLLVVFAWIPWVMTSYQVALARGTWRSALIGAAALGLAVLGGHPPLVLYTGLMLITLWLYHVLRADHPIQAAWYAGQRLAVIGIGGAILGAALLLPSAELSSLSSRSSSDLSFANSFALPPAQFISLALPDFFGNPKVPPYYYWGADFFQEFMAYAGLLPLLAIPLVFRWSLRERWYFLGLVALGLVMSIGAEGGLMPVLWQWIPGFTAFRTPGRSLYFVMFGVAGLTALLITALQRSDSKTCREALRPAVRLWLPVAAGLVLAGALLFLVWYANASGSGTVPVRALLVSKSLATAGVIILAIWFVLWLWMRASVGKQEQPRWAQLALLLTCLLVILDAWHFGESIIGVSQINEDPVWAGARANVPLGADSRVVAPGGYENLASVTGHLNVAGYDPLPIETYSKFAALGNPADPTSAVNTLLGVKYLFTTRRYHTRTSFRDFALIGTTSQAFYYQRNYPFPRTWIAPSVVVDGNDDRVLHDIASGKVDMRSTVYLDRALPCIASGDPSAKITEYKANSLEIKTSGGAGVLTVSDQFYPGWQATVDGQPTDIVRADAVFRAVCVPPGDHTVRFDYRPGSLYVGVAISAAGWLALFAFAIFALVSGRRKKVA